MADPSNADARRVLTVDPPPHHLPKDMHDSDNSTIPLSPQWLQPKTVESKQEFSPHPGGRPDAAKLSGNGVDFYSSGKKKEAFRPSFHDVESGRRDRWHEEERETNAVRRDRWREGDKEPGETRRVERWSDFSSKNSMESRRAPPGKWTDSGNREGDQRRESQWNTRWGSDDNESGNWREKSADASKDGDRTHEKGFPNLTDHGKDINNQGKETERDDHHSRSWRSNYAAGRGRGDPSHHQSQVPSKQTSLFGHGRGRTDNGISISTAGRGRFSSNMSTTSIGTSRSYHLGSFSDKSDSALCDPPTFRYSRMKLLDIFRSTDVKSFRLSLDGFVEAPPLTQEEPLQPLALSAPSLDESVILKGIDKGDIVSSGVPQASKDGSVGRTTADTVSSRPFKLGSREDLPTAGDTSRDDRPVDVKVVDTGAYVLSLDETTTREVTRPENSSTYVVPQRSHSAGVHAYKSSHDWKDFSPELRSRDSDPSWSGLQNDMGSYHKNNSATNLPFCRDEAEWRNVSAHGFHSDTKSDMNIERQPSNVMEECKVHVMLSREDSLNSKDVQATGKLQSHPSPEDLSLYYRDPQGHIQGPFSGSDLIGWFEAGYFGIDLPVRVASFPADAPFTLLGDIIPHLRMKARPPPGFGVTKQSETPEDSYTMKFANLSNASSHNAHTSLGKFDMLKNEQRSSHKFATEAQNLFIESLMSVNMSTSPTESLSFTRGMQGPGESSSGKMPSLLGESGDEMNLLSQTRLLERQRSFSEPLPYWAARDSLPVASNTEMIPDSSSPHSKHIPPTGDTSRQILQSSQNIDLLSLLHAAAEKSPQPAVSSGSSLWSNFSDGRSLNSTPHGGIDISHEMLGMHQNQHVPSQVGYGVQQQRSKAPNPPHLPHLIAQPGEFSSGLMPPEKMLSSDISQDPRVLSLLQQQYLLSQLQLHAQVPVPPQLSLLDKILLLQQQHKHEQQQQQFLMQQQQQQLLMQQQQQQLLMQQQHHLLSQVLSGHQPHQQFGDTSVSQASGAMPAGNTLIDHLGLQRAQELSQINQQMPFANQHIGQTSSLQNAGMQGTIHITPLGSGALPLQLPHQIFNQPNSSKESDASFSVDNEYFHSASLILPDLAESLPLPDVLDKLEQNSQACLTPGNLEVEHTSGSISQTGQLLSQLSSEDLSNLKNVEESKRSSNLASSITDQVHDMNIPSEKLPDQQNTDASLQKEATNADTREVKKASEKKSRKQKNAKTQINHDLGKGQGKTVAKQKSNLETEFVGPNSCGLKEVHTDLEDTLCRATLGAGEGNSVLSSAELRESQISQLAAPSMSILADESETVQGESESAVVGREASNVQTTSAWKSAPGLKPKSLLEIQQEEQLRAQRAVSSEMMVLPASSPPIPTATITGLENKYNRDSFQAPTSVSALGNSKNTLNVSSKRSQLHDLLAEEVLAKSNEIDADPYASDLKPSIQPSDIVASGQADISAVPDGDFIEAKDSRKSRRKASKSKGAAVKVPSPVGSAEMLAAPSLDKGKSMRHVQQDREILHAPPAGPSLGDFVPWKGDQGSSVPSPAWSMDSGKPQRPTSLRDILKEQEKKAAPMQQTVPLPTSSKVQPNRSSRAGGTSWQVPGSSSQNAASPIQISSQVSTHLKSKAEDDLFWGPLEQSKPEPKQLDFPSLISTGSLGVKGTSSKGAPGAASSRQKPSSGRPVEQSSLPHSPASNIPFSRGRSDASSKTSEAMDFRNWCENEWVRLTGTNDTSFLEFCIKQSTSEAEMSLRENLGSLDRNHEFIDKFLNYKEFLSSDVIEIAFQAPKSQSLSGNSSRHGNSNISASRDIAAGKEDRQDGPGKGGGGKKKGKKGQKVSPLVLGFNVVSNRIMMGEIQSIEE